MAKNVFEAFRSVGKTLEGMREPVEAASAEHFMGLVDTQPGSKVEVYPAVSYESHTQRWFDGVTGELQRLETVSGAFLRTSWEGKTSKGRTVLARENHGSVSANRYWYREECESAQKEQFKEAVNKARALHELFPQVLFVVNGHDGMRDVE